MAAYVVGTVSHARLTSFEKLQTTSTGQRAYEGAVLKVGHIASLEQKHEAKMKKVSNLEMHSNSMHLVAIVCRPSG